MGNNSSAPVRKTPPPPTAPTAISTDFKKKSYVLGEIVDANSQLQECLETSADVTLCFLKDGSTKNKISSQIHGPAYGILDQEGVKYYLLEGDENRGNFMRVVDSVDDIPQNINDIDVMRRYSHPNIMTCKYYEFNTENQKQYCVFDIPLGNLYYRVSRDFKSNLISYSNLCSALSFLHREGRVHFDIRPENILIFPDDEVKLFGFDLSEPFSGENSEINFRKNPKYWLMYRPPEIDDMKRGQIREEYDSWGMGFILFQFLTGLSHVDVINNDREFRTRNVDFSNDFFLESLLEKMKEILILGEYTYICTDLNQNMKRVARFEIEDVELVMDFLRRTVCKENRMKVRDYFSHPLFTKYGIENRNSGTLLNPSVRLINSLCVNNRTLKRFFSLSELKKCPIEIAFLSIDIYQRSISLLLPDYDTNKDEDMVMLYIFACFKLANYYLSYKYKLQISTIINEILNAEEKKDQYLTAYKNMFVSIYKILNGIVYPKNPFHRCGTKESVKKCFVRALECGETEQNLEELVENKHVLVEDALME